MHITAEVVFTGVVFLIGIFLGRRWTFVELDAEHVNCVYCRKYHDKFCTQVVPEGPEI